MTPVMELRKVMQVSSVADSAPAVSCCSAFYEQDWVRHLAEDIFHPGGEELTQKTIAAMNLGPGASIADLGCGTGTSALMLAGDPGLNINAIDIGEDNIRRARDRLSTEGKTPGNVRFQQADAHELPFEDGQFDGVLAECTFSLFSNQETVLTEIKRVLKPRGQLGVTDMAVGGPLPDDIASVVAPWTCLVDAVDQQAYAETFTRAGFEIREFSDESDGLINLINLLKRKLLMLGVGSVLAGVSVPKFDLAEIKFWLDRFTEEVEKGTIRYLRFNLQKL
jgi:ubiquinone/menaquinone biosynthesis C-methylase UbiE